MSSAVALPTLAWATRLLGDLLDRPVTGKEIAPADPTGAGWVAGVYVEEVGAPRALLAFDVSLAASIAAAFTLVPLKTAEASIRASRLSPELLENFREVLNVCARLVNTAGAPHLTLKEAVVSPYAAPIASFVKQSRLKATFEVTVPGYKSGKSVAVI